VSAGSTGQERRDHLDSLAVLLIVLCCFLWGLQQVAVKAILPEAPPLFQGALRSLGAALLLWGWSALRGVELWQRDGTLLPGILAGLLFGGEFACIYLGLPHTSASRFIVFLYTAPFVLVALLSWRLPSERLAPLQLTGMVCAFAALAYAFQEGFGEGKPDQLLGDALAIGGAVLWALTTLVVRATPLSGASPEKTLLYQLAVSAILLAIASLAIGESWPRTVSLLTVASLLFQTVIVAFASYLAWFWLLRHYAATKVSAFSFLTPMFGLLQGTLLLGEAVSTRLVVALVFVAAGIYLVNRPAATRAPRAVSR
jgi:drug/metabolite transporter (DMT)-like permease